MSWIRHSLLAVLFCIRKDGYRLELIVTVSVLLLENSSRLSTSLFREREMQIYSLIATLLIPQYSRMLKAQVEGHIMIKHDDHILAWFGWIPSFNRILCRGFRV